MFTSFKDRKDLMGFPEKLEDLIAVGGTDLLAVQQGVGAANQLEQGAQGSRGVEILIQSGQEVLERLGHLAGQVGVLGLVVRDLANAQEKIADSLKCRLGPFDSLEGEVQLFAVVHR